MNGVIARTAHALLVVLLLATAAAPACVGSGDCRMPCCRHTPEPVSHPHAAEGTAPAPCCPQTADTADGTGPGCRWVQDRLALPSGAETGPGFTATAAVAVRDDPFPWQGWSRELRRADSTPPEKRRYLRLLTLLI